MDREGFVARDLADAREGAKDGVNTARDQHPWVRHYPPGLDWALEIEPSTIHGLFDRSVAKFADKTIIEYRGRKIGFSELGRAVDGFAAALLARGIGPGKTVALYLPNTPWHSVCFFGALKAGARVAHLSPLDAPRELAFKLQDSAADVLVSTDLFDLSTKAIDLKHQGKVAEVLIGEDEFWNGDRGAPVPYGDGVVELSPMLATPPPAAWPIVQPGDLAVLQYTGGTTGMPKGAMLTHANITAATAIYLVWRDDSMPPVGQQRVIGVLPMFHIYALIVVLMLCVAQGEEILLRPRYDAMTTLTDIAERKATSFPAVPTMLIALLAAAEASGVKHDLSSLAWVGSGGAPLPYEVGQRVEAFVGSSLRGGWGMTETCSAGTRLPPGRPAEAGMIGVPLPRIEMRVVALDDPLRVLPPGAVGELAVKGPNIFGGYWNQPELSKEAFAEGYFLTGDIGTMTEDGLFKLVDRKKRMIISGGFNVYPTMIENSIYEHPDVEEVIVIGVPDAYRGETAKAFIKLREGAAPMTIDVLRGFLADKIGRHEVPTALELREMLPKSPVGKLMATQLVEEERAKTQSPA